MRPSEVSLKPVSVLILFILNENKVVKQLIDLIIGRHSHKDTTQGYKIVIVLRKRFFGID